MKQPRNLKYGGDPGTVNWRAVAKVSILVVWLVVPALVDKPLFPFNYAIEYVQDASSFMENNTTWWALSEQGRIFYVVFPIPWFVCGAAWYEIWFRTRRKRLIINGQREGVVMFVLGDSNHKVGHLYDLACVLNGFRHIRMKDFPRPITGDEHPPGVNIYYRRNLLTNPISYPKISTMPVNITWGYHTLWVDGEFRTRVRNPRRPVLDYEVLLGEPPYQVEGLELNEFSRGHRRTQETIMKDNYRMTVSEPGTAKTLVRSSMMTISEDTKNEYLDLLPSEVRARILLESIEESEDDDGEASVGR